MDAQKTTPCISFLTQFPETQATLLKWCNKQQATVLFDSREKGWHKGSKEFEDAVLHHAHLALVVTDMDGNIFGGYTSVPVEKAGEWVNDPSAFVFSLESNGRLPEPAMFKMQAQNGNHAVVIYNEYSDFLFQWGAGFDILVARPDHSVDCNSVTNASSFGYGSIPSPLTGSTSFIPSRIVALELS